MNIFLKALLRGEFLTTSKFEAMLNSMPETEQRYERVRTSDKLREYKELEQLVKTDAFQTNKKQMLADKAHKAEWPTSPEGKQEARYNELKKDADILFFLGQKGEEVNYYNRMQVVFKDDFNWGSMQQSDWKSGLLYPSADFQGSHSYNDCLQGYTKGRNVETHDGVLHLVTRKEHVQAAAWDAKKGMVMKDFDYSSDVMHTDKVAIQEGDIIQVKVRATGKLHHGIYLSNNKQRTHVSLFETRGKRVFLGVKGDKGESKKEMRDVRARYDMVYTLVWQNDNLIWYVNNMEVYRTTYSLLGEKLYLHFMSAMRKGDGTGSMMVDWVRVLRKK